MTELDLSRPEMRVVLLAPTVKDAAASRDILGGAGLPCQICRNLDEVCRAILQGAGAAIVTEEALLRDRSRALLQALRPQPQWSDLPVIVLTAAGPDSPHKVRTLLDLGGTTLLKRPLEVAVFLNAVRTALRDRARQYLVRDHLAEQARQAEALREADQRKDEFLAMLAHELRNPLAPIRTGLQIIRVAEGDRKAVADTRDMMDRQVQHLARLVDDLLEVSRITRGKVELRKERVDLAEVVTQAVETVRPLIDARKHRLTISQPGGPVWIIADLTRMTQVITNLLNNAAKYSAERGQISLSLEQAGDEAVIRVRDAGAGISADMLPKVFDLFIQVDRTLDRSQGGLGIGLTLVRRLVELHGGRVEASSDGVGRGSEFVVYLPLPSDDELRRCQGTSEKPSAHQPRYRILVVDDNVDAAESLATLLRLSGHEARTVHHGLKVLEVARSLRPDVVILDLGLPGIDGYEVAHRLRAESWGKDVLLFALTGYGQEEDRRRTQAAGFDYHLTKPADPLVLQRLLTERGRC